ncbi:MAG TPA: quinoprotein dehydrogenase-associated putative ABC transporter substrate-binding protein [Caldimonas sp.]|nr:quinoprotein dehydrogenase-associated putative ABC transporter substrate-binding protein [Caldimonas sp.]
MSSACPDRRRIGAVAVALAALLAMPCALAERTLRVCAEPDNLPLSNAREAGFENRIARVVAGELGATLVYEWQPQRRGFVRKTIGADVCDVWIGVPAGLDRVLTTRPYYRSGYVFVNRADAREPLASFADPRLATLRIGVQLIGNDLAASPPALALARAGATARVVGYPVYGEGSAAERISLDLAAGRLDAALVWGPQAGYFVDHAPAPLAVVRAVAPAGFDVPFEFSIAMGVRKDDAGLRRDLDAALERRGAEIDAILEAYGVPRLDDGATALSAVSTGKRP